MKWLTHLKYAAVRDFTHHALQLRVSLFMVSLKASATLPVTCTLLSLISITAQTRFMRHTMNTNVSWTWKNCYCMSSYFSEYHTSVSQIQHVAALLAAFRQWAALPSENKTQMLHVIFKSQTHYVLSKNYGSFLRSLDWFLMGVAHSLTWAPVSKCPAGWV